MQVSKWGNSLAVRLPAAVVEALALKERDEIEIHVADARAFEVRRRPAARELLARLRKFRGRLPADFRFDRLEAHERRRPVLRYERPALSSFRRLRQGRSRGSGAVRGRSRQRPGAERVCVRHIAPLNMPVAETRESLGASAPSAK